MATPAEIKEAYRDLARVWHPDRFGTDPRLHSKAEETLKGINEAYQLLQSGATGRRASTPPQRPPPPTPPKQHRTSPARTSPTTVPGTPSGRFQPFWNAMRSWRLALIVMLGLGWIGSLRNDSRATSRTERTVSLPAPNRVGAPLVYDAGKFQTQSPIAKGQRPGAALPPPKPIVPDSQSQESPEEQSTAATSPTPEATSGWQPPPFVVIHETPTAYAAPASAAPRGRREYSELSRPEQQSIEAACSTAKYLEGPAAYNRCLLTQLTQLGRAPSRPDLSKLSRPEQQSIEAACSTARYSEGPAAYNRCLQTQLTQLGRAPSRPDLSKLSRPEQQSIEAACSTAKYSEGPAAYNRCLVGQLRLVNGRD
jgi:hypothetical protein